MLPLFALFSAPAQAFCGTFVGDPSSTPTNDASQVVIARYDRQTVLTVIMDYEGTASEFGILLPIPEVVHAEDVGSIDRELITWLDTFSQPRQIAYTCDDVFGTTERLSSGCALGFGCSDSSLGPGGFADTGLGVSVEAQFTEYGYDFAVLAANEAEGLQSWLDGNGYVIPEGGADILQEYIDAGVYFLAVKVSTAEVPQINGWLPPIQLRYEADSLGLPIRIGTISASGPQDVVVYTLTPVTDGEVGITNYPALPIVQECMWEGDDFLAFYEGEIEATAAAEGAGWVREYSWDLIPEVGTGYHCDPCTADPAAPTADGTFNDFGLPSDSAHLTRLHLRYSPEEATQDVAFAVSGITGVNEQLRFIEPDRSLESLFPYCDGGWAEDPGTCPVTPGGRFGSSFTGLLAAFGLAGALAARRRSR